MQEAETCLCCVEQVDASLHGSLEDICELLLHPGRQVPDRHWPSHISCNLINARFRYLFEPGAKALLGIAPLERANAQPRNLKTAASQLDGALLICNLELLVVAFCNTRIEYGQFHLTLQCARDPERCGSVASSADAEVQPASCSVLRKCSW